jgi:hypothetical protein
MEKNLFFFLKVYITIHLQKEKGAKMKEKNISYLQRSEQLINAGRCKRGSSHEQIYTLLSFRNLLHQAAA